PVYISNMDLLYNKQGGLMEDFKMREAVNTALDIDDILQASFADEELYLVDSGYMSKDIRHWASDAGSDKYNQNDPEKAKQLFDEIRTSPSQEEAKAYWDELQEYAWTEFLPITKLGTFSRIYAVSDKVEGFTVGQMGAMLWNTKVEE